MISRVSDNLGLPSLLLFLGVGMLAGYDGLGKIYFDDVQFTQDIALISLVFILFSGGLETRLKEIKPFYKSALSLSTLGVILTTLVVSAVVYFAIGLSISNSLLIGAIVSSTDAAAVFSVLKGRNIRLTGGVKPVLELESGSNDPLAVILTLVFIQFSLSGGFSTFSVISFVVLQLVVGATAGYVLGRVCLYLLKRFRFSQAAFYPVFLVSSCVFIYSATSLLHGSGILAVYVAALTININEFVQKKTLIRFFEGLALLAQICMFLTLGLLVFPSQLKNVAMDGIIVSAALIFLARPIGVFVSLMFSKFKFNEKLFISWVGLRGSVPIILATFPRTAGLDIGQYIFNLVFFITIASVLVQGWSLGYVARFLGVIDKKKPAEKMALELTDEIKTNNELVDFIIPQNSALAGKALAELNLPPESLITVIYRGDDYFVPSGSSVLNEGDTILVLANKENIDDVRKVLRKMKSLKA